MRHIVIIAILDPDDRWFVHQRHAHKRVFPSLWGIGAGGTRETGESVHAAAARELREETGLDTAVHPVMDVVDEPTAQHLHLFVTLAAHVPAPCAREWSRWEFIDSGALCALQDQGLLCPDTSRLLDRLAGGAQPRSRGWHEALRGALSAE